VVIVLSNLFSLLPGKALADRAEDYHVVPPFPRMLLGLVLLGLDRSPFPSPSGIVRKSATDDPADPISLIAFPTI
jgi:hypothetical protein